MHWATMVGGNSSVDKFVVWVCASWRRQTQHREWKLIETAVCDVGRGWVAAFKGTSNHDTTRLHVSKKGVKMGWCSLPGSVGAVQHTGVGRSERTPDNGSTVCVTLGKRHSSQQGAHKGIRKRVLHTRSLQRCRSCVGTQGVHLSTSPISWSRNFRRALTGTFK